LLVSTAAQPRGYDEKPNNDEHRSSKAMKFRYSKLTISILVAGLLVGCVTTTNRGPIKTDAAHDKRVELGMKYLEVGKRDNARYQFSKALELQKNSPRAYHGVALVHQANGEMGHAEDAFKKALRYATGTQRAPIFVSYGRFLMDQKESHKACDYFEKAAADFDYKGRSDALHQAALCAQATGNTQRVKPAFEHALNLNPDYLPSILPLAEIYFGEGEYDRSKRLLSKFESLSKPTSASLWLGVRIERVFGNKDKEASYALALRNLHPYSKEYLEYRNSVEKR
jgi:type IV pilus assembly protein PilF